MAVFFQLAFWTIQSIAIGNNFCWCPCSWFHLKAKETFIAPTKFECFEHFDNRFLQEISETDLKKNSKIIFLCRSGARSRSAAEFLTSQGYESCFNCSEGFEGSHDSLGHRSKVNGWKFHDLPWKQG